MDVIRVDGKLRAVVRVTWPSGEVETEALGDLLARHLLVGKDYLTLGDVLIAAGWRPPSDSDSIIR